MSLSVETLLLDAKVAILQDHLRRFYDLHREGRWEDAVDKAYTTIECAADILQSAVKILEQVAGKLPPAAKY